MTLYSECEMKVFGPYDDGTGQEVFADPIDVQQCMACLLGGNPNEFLRAWRSPDPTISYPAGRQMVAAAAQAFGLQLFDRSTGKGLLLHQVRELVERYLTWCIDQKKSGDGSLTSPPATASPLGRSVTKGSADCGCSKTASDSSGPSPSARELQPQRVAS